MKKALILFILLLSLFQLSFAQVQATFNLKRFSAKDSPYIETYLEIYSNSLHLNELDSNHLTTGIDIVQLIKNEKEEIIDFKKYSIYDTLKKETVFENIIDLQRFQLPNGNYSIEIQLKDRYTDQDPQIHTEKFNIEFIDHLIQMSDIELLDYYWKTDEELTTSKSGYGMIPLVTDYFSPEFNRLAYYFEIYNAEKYLKEGSSYILLQSIKIRETGNIAGQFNKLKKVKSSEVTPVLNSFNIENLPTGNYELVIQIRDQSNDLILEKKQLFQRTNGMISIDLDYLNAVEISNNFTKNLPKDSLDEFINCLAPIASPNELMIIDRKLEKMSDSTKRQFFYSFWYNQNNVDPQNAWEDYKLQVKKIEKLFATKVRRGYQTDRGRVYLKYGAPNNIIDRPNEPSAYPYQIWHYHKIGKFNNKRFIFYMPDLVTNEYTVLHSDVPGEFFNSKWQKDLNGRMTRRGNIDDNLDGDNWGSNSDVLFRNP